MARFETQCTSFTLHSESIDGSLLVLFYNSMLISERSLTNHAMKSEQLVHLTNQTSGADISTMSYICGKCIETKTFFIKTTETYY